ncbi:MAG: type VI secretion system tube protein Hcp [Sphingobacteriales bacterium]|nr:type VI secretion system tube protein Hcp [Sphingobacteriales bacterium]
MKKISLPILLLVFFLPLSGFGQTITISVEGTKQGKFKGESQKGKFADKSELAGYLLEITSPRDVASGQASGRRTFQPVLLLKATGASSPQFLQALSTNELLKKVVIDFYRPDPSGMEINYFTVTLENASISGYKQFTGPLENEKFNPVNTILYDEIKLVYQRITVEDKINKTMTTDENMGGRSFQ